MAEDILTQTVGGFDPNAPRLTCFEGEWISGVLVAGAAQDNLNAISIPAICPQFQAHRWYHPPGPKKCSTDRFNRIKKAGAAGLGILTTIASVLGLRELS